MLLLAADSAPGLAVMDFAVEGAPPEIAAATSGLVAHEAKAQRFRVLAWVSTGVAAAGAGAVTATVLFVIGDPPGRYEAYRQKTGVVSMSLSPTPGGAVLSGAF